MAKKILDYPHLNFVICNHVVGEKDKEIFGPGDAVLDFLINKKARNLWYLRFGLWDQKYHTRISCYENGILKQEKFGINSSSISVPLRYFVQALYSIYAIFKYAKKVNFDVWIGCNSLNSFSGIILKKLGKVKKVVFYTIDYVPKRFDSQLLNWIYHQFDRFCLKNSDQVWNNSEVMTQIRVKQGVLKSKNLKIGHGADLTKIIIPSEKEIKKDAMVVVGNLTKAIKFDLIINSLKKVVEKNKSAEIILIGSGSSEEEIRKMVKKAKLEKNFKFLGRMDHDSLLKQLPKYGVGLAIYGNTFDWNLYSDSLKVKEYVACGLPVIMSGAPAAQKEIKESGAVMFIDINQNQLTQAMVKLLTDKKIHSNYRQKALKYREFLDWNKIYESALFKL